MGYTEEIGVAGKPRAGTNQDLVLRAAHSNPCFDLSCVHMDPSPS